jgi:cytochrome P450
MTATTTTAASKPLPPGTEGLPLIGETPAFIRDMFGFIRTRSEKHGPIFRTSILGQRTIVISGADITDQWLDETLVQRGGSFPKNVQELFGGASLPLLDDAAHRTRKELVMQALRRDALASYLPRLEKNVERAFARWAASGELRFIDELRRLAIEGICGAMLGDADAELDAILADYSQVGSGFTALPIPLALTTYSAALRARDRVLSRWRRHIEERAKQPTDDGISRLLAARTETGAKLAPDELALELHHIVLAGMIIFAEFAATVIALDKLPEVRSKLEKELTEIAPSGALTPQRLAKMPYLMQIVMETKRHCPNVPVSFGKARRTFELGGYTIPKDTLIFMAIVQNNMNKRVWTNPETFDPERFGDGRKEHLRHPHGFQPQGAGAELSHRCAGVDFSSMFMQVFTVHLVRDHALTLPPQNLSLRMGMMPPEPKDGLRATIRRRG